MTPIKLAEKQKTLVKILLLIAVLVILLFGIQWITYERQPLPKAIAALESDNLVQVTRKPWLTFSPVKGAPATGFVFYPGGRISYLGYSDFMRNIASQGYLVVVPQMPFNIAAANPNVASEIINSHPEITHWVIGGHSVGGTMAAQYTKTHNGMIAGLVIWASYPADNADLSGSTIPVALIYGSLDPAANDESVLMRRRLLPESALVVRIDGGDHHQFGSYEINPEDRHATIDRNSQMEQIIQSTLSLLKTASK